MANATPPTQLTISFTDGTTETFALTAPQGEETQMVSRLKHIMESNCLMLEVDDKLIMLPMQNIRAIEVTPSLPKLPDTALRHLQRLT